MLVHGDSSGEVERQCWCMETHQGRWSVSAGACMETHHWVERQCWCMEAHQGRWSVSTGARRLIRGGGVSVLVHGGSSGEVEGVSVVVCDIIGI